MKRIARVFQLALLLTASLGAAQGSVEGIWPQRALTIGDQSLDLAFETTGSVSAIELDVTGTSPAGAFVTLTAMRIPRAANGAFRVLAPLTAALPEHAQLSITARPLSDTGTPGSPFSVNWSSDAAGVSLPAAPRVSSSGNAVALSVQFTGPLAFAEATLVGVSGAALRGVNGNLQAVQQGSFVNVRRVRGALRGNRVEWAVPTTDAVPFDGVVVADLTFEDVFGRRTHRSVVEFATDALDSVASLEVAPNAVLLNQGTGTVSQLHVSAGFMLQGNMALTAPMNGLVFSSSDETVALVDASGRVVAVANGSATITVTYAGVTASIPVVVDSNATVQSMAVEPSTTEVPRVGTSTRLRLKGALSTGLVVDLSSPGLGTLWRSSDPTIAAVSADGVITALKPGTVTVIATRDNVQSSALVTVRDGLPTIQLRGPGSVRAGERFEVVADVTDDLGVAHVEWRVNGVPTATTPTRPHTFVLWAPPTSGSALQISAVVEDSGHQRVTAPTLRIPVTSGGAAVSGTPIVVEQPSTGLVVPAGAPFTFRITSGNWMPSRSPFRRSISRRCASPLTARQSAPRSSRASKPASLRAMKAAHSSRSTCRCGR